MIQSQMAKYLIMIGTSVIIIGATFLSLLQHFVLTLPKTPPDLPHADGIIVATGGQARLHAGLDLLARGTAPQLLLTGVGQGITKQMIADSTRLTQRRVEELECCVSLEFEAKDTVGNALATKAWANQRDLKTIVLVTSDYHMPRAFLEFAHHMPQRAIIAYPISAPDLAGKSWYSDWQTYRLYAREFLKYRLRALALLF